LMGFSLLPENIGRNMAIISGPGGLAVSAAEACGNEGLCLASLSEQTQSQLSDFVPSTGTSTRNPVDVSLSAHLDLTIFRRSAETVARDPGVDAVAIIGGGLTPEDSPTGMPETSDHRGNTRLRAQPEPGILSGRDSLLRIGRAGHEDLCSCLSPPALAARTCCIGINGNGLLPK